MLKRIISIIFVVVILSGSIYLIENKEKFSKKVKLVDSKEFNTTEIDSINIDLISTDIEVKDSLNDKVIIEYYDNTESNIKINLNNNIVRVKENDDNNKCKIFCIDEGKLVIYIPTNYTNKINIKTVSSDVEINSIYNITINTVSGDVEIGNVLDKANINTTSGDIEIDELNIKNNSSITTTSGDIDINNNKSDCFIEPSTVSGDKSIKNSNIKSDIILKLKTVSGDISVQ